MSQCALQSTWQGICYKWTWDKSGQSPERPPWKKVLIGKWAADRHVYEGFTLFSNVPETFPEGRFTAQVIDRPNWINSLRGKTMACLCSLPESPKFLLGPETKMRSHSVDQKSCNTVDSWELKKEKVYQNSHILPRGSKPSIDELQWSSVSRSFLPSTKF